MHESHKNDVLQCVTPVLIGRPTCRYLPVGLHQQIKLISWIG